MSTIEVLIDEEGNVTIDAIGFHGKGCDAATAALEKALGKVKSKTKKKEFFDVENPKVRNPKLRI